MRLYERAMDDVKHGRYESGRITLQTLLNTYSDSEYAPKAKLAIADSYFKEGGVGGLTQAVAEYQDFIVFFPYVDEAAYAQKQIGLAYFRRMEKPDQDRDSALEAEASFQIYLQKYPRTDDSAKVAQYLREVQEVLAEGDYGIASFYYIRHVDRAASARLAELVNRYPLFSQADLANMMLASIYERTEHNDLAAQIYTRVVKNYPLSPLAAEAKAKLVKLGAPVPQPDPTAMARMEKEQQTPREKSGMFLTRPVASLFRSTPDVSMAARVGTPTLTPEDQQSNEALTPGNLTIGTARISVASSSGATGDTTGTAAFVETVAPGSAASTAPPASDSSSSAPAQDPGTPAPPAASGTGDTQTSSTADTAPAAGSSTQKESSSKKKKKKILPF